MKWRLYKEKLLWLRLNQGWSQEEAAERCGAPDKKTYHLWETGKIERPQARNLDKIVKGFDLNSIDKIILKPAAAPSPELSALYNAHFNAHVSPLVATNQLNESTAYKLICFDLEATLIHGLNFSPRAVWEALGDDGRERTQGIRSYYSGKFNYEEWVLWVGEMFKEKGLTQQMLNEIIGKYNLAPQLREGLQQLKKQGYKLVIISVGLKNFLKHLLPDWKDYFDYVFINEIEFSGDGYMKNIIPSSFGIDKTLDGLRQVCTKESICLEQVIFVGNSFVSRQLICSVGLSIGYTKPSKEVSELFHVQVKDDDFNEVVRVITQQRKNAGI